MILVSACLVGINCKYSGGNNFNQKIFDLVKEGKAIPICPEQLGGLKTPRKPVELKVIDGKRYAIDNEGNDVTENFERGDKVKSHLTYGAEHDSMVEWFIESGAMYREEIERHPIKKCNQKKSKKIARTGSKKTVQINNICDLPVEDTEWTQESIVSNRFGGMYRGGCQVQRGGNSIYNSKNSMAYRTKVIPVDVCENTGFRIVLCLK